MIELPEAVAIAAQLNKTIRGKRIVASVHEPMKVFEYVMRNKKEMPRTALRYAIEKLSPNLRKQAMAKE